MNNAPIQPEKILSLSIPIKTIEPILSPSIHKFANEFIYSGLSAEGVILALGPEKYVTVFANRSTK
jgi:hypothetical protein